MNALRWVFGLPLAIVAVCLVNWAWQSVFQSTLYNYATQHPEINHISKGLEAFISNGLLVFLSCWFIPSSKKHIGMGWIIIMLGHFAFEYFGNQDIADNVNARPLENIAPIFGLLGGFYFSYIRFKNNNWGSSAKGNIDETLA